MKKILLSIAIMPGLVFAYSNSFSPDKMQVIATNNGFNSFYKATVGIKLKDALGKTISTCTGVALNHRTILTAAHCVVESGKNNTFPLRQIRLYLPFAGSSGKKLGDFNDFDGAIFVAPEYNGTIAPKDENAKYDLALIKLNNNLGINKLIPEENTLKGLGVGIPDVSVKDGKGNDIYPLTNSVEEFKRYPFRVNSATFYAIGWGSHYDDGGNIYEATSAACTTLSTLNSDLITQLSRYSILNLGLIHDTGRNEYCSSPGIYAEPGDSGGPIFMQMTNKKFQLIGITVTISRQSSITQQNQYNALLKDNPTWEALKDVAVVDKTDI